MKKLIPARIRNYVRPGYQRLRRSLEKAMESRLWVNPPGWTETKAELRSLDRPLDLYRFSADKLGLIQIESEIVSFLEFAGATDPIVVGEIGLKNGGNTLLFMHALPNVQRMFALDIRINNEGRIRSLAKPGQKLTFIEGDTHSLPVRHKLARALRGQKFDLLFIDGDHSYDGVRQDFEQYKALVRDGGLIAFHDIVADEATRTGSDPGGNCYAGGVHRFWAEIKDQYQHQEFVESWEQSGFGIGVIKYAELPCS